MCFALGLIGMIFVLDCMRFCRIVWPTFCGCRDAPNSAMVLALKKFFVSPIKVLGC